MATTGSHLRQVFSLAAPSTEQPDISLSQEEVLVGVAPRYGLFVRGATLPVVGRVHQTTYGWMGHFLAPNRTACSRALRRAQFQLFL